MATRIKRAFHNMSVKYKIVWITLVIAIVPLFLFSVIITRLYSDVIEDRSRNHAEENLVVFQRRFYQRIADCINCSNYITVNINSIISDREKNEVTISGMILSELETAKIIFHEIESIVYIDSNGTFYCTDLSLFEKEAVIKESDYMTELRSTTGKTILFNSSEDKIMASDTEQEQDIISFGKKVINISSGKTLGYLFINIGADMAGAEVKNQISHYYIFDQKNYCLQGAEDNRLVYDLNIKSWLGGNRESTMMKSHGIQYLVTGYKSSEYKWSIVGITNMDEFNVGTREILSVLFYVGIILVGMLVILSFILTNLITKPLIQLKYGAEKIAEGDLEVTFRFKTEDEIGKLGSIFNYMTKRIRELLIKVDYEAKKKREYELSLIQEQVKPHFLYNTLDIIIMLIQMNKSRVAQRVTKKLADYYKNSLSNSEEVIPLEREIRIVEDYLELQLMRYENKFTYNFDIEIETRQARLPKMTLQPLVENAIYHGLKYKENWGNITIRSRLLQDKIELSVIDNGIGMDDVVVNQTIQLLNEPINHFGVYSVNHRLKLFFGDEYGIQILSKYEEGTEIRITLPHMENDYDKNNDCR